MEDLKDLYVVSIKVFNPAETLNKFEGSTDLISNFFYIYIDTF